MPCRRRTIIGYLAAGAAVLALAAGSAVVGRLSADDDGARAAGYRSGSYDGYFKGLRAGEAQGRQQGRAMQEGANLPAADRRPVRHAFDDGYAAGHNDTFAGYDGGWQLSVPYVVVLAGGTGRIVYRIASREPVTAGVNYYLCPNGRDLCQEPRP